MTIQVFCPKWYYTTQLDRTQQDEIVELFKEFIDDRTKFTQPNWNCNVLSTFQTEANKEAPWDEFLRLLKPHFDEFVDQVGTRQNIEILVEDAWINKYSFGDSQEFHDHCLPTVNLSMVYFYSVPPDTTSKFKFYNTEHAPYQMSGLSQTLNAPSEQLTVPETTEGTLLLFPSHYGHLVSPHRSEHQRITISMNFKVIPQNETKGS